MFLTTEEVKCLPIELHDGQFRHDGVTPYWHHLEKVASLVDQNSWVEMQSAWLHDCMEDCGVTVSDLKNHRVHNDVIRVVVAMTHASNESYSEYISRLKGSVTAYHVKIADIRANLSDDPTKRQAIKYAKALLLLLCGVNDFSS